MNIIKKIILLCLAICFGQSLFSQKSARPVRYVPEHEFRISLGLFPLNINGSNSDLLEAPDPIILSDQYDRSLYYYGPAYTTGSLSASYTYYIKKWFSVGASFSYINQYRNHYNIITDSKILEIRYQSLYLTPMLRFTFVNKRYVKLYGQIGVGLGLHMGEESDATKKLTSNKCMTSMQFTFFGVSVGRKFFGFTELGVGSQGIINIGTGYRFNAK